MSYGRGCCHYNSGAMLKLAAEITERTLLRQVADATEYVVIGLAVEATALKLAADALQ